MKNFIIEFVYCLIMGVLSIYVIMPHINSYDLIWMIVYMQGCVGALIHNTLREKE